MPVCQMCSVSWLIYPIAWKTIKSVVPLPTTASAIHDKNVQNSTGSISVADLEEGLRQLNVFDGMSKEQARLATRRFDHDGDGTVSLPEFLAFVGKPYAVNDRPLEAKLRRVLLKAESVRVQVF